MRRSSALRLPLQLVLLARVWKIVALPREEFLSAVDDTQGASSSKINKPLGLNVAARNTN